MGSGTEEREALGRRFRDVFWARHASPWSAGTRILASPVLVYAIYSRRRRLLGAVVAFLIVNPVLFPRPVRTDSWLSRGVLAEREWMMAGNRTLGFEYPNLLNLLSVPTWILALAAAIRRRPIVTIVATASAMALKLYWIDVIIGRTGVTGDAGPEAIDSTVTEDD